VINAALNGVAQQIGHSLMCHRLDHIETAPFPTGSQTSCAAITFVGPGTHESADPKIRHAGMCERIHI
jgi:hypothetical protein